MNKKVLIVAPVACYPAYSGNSARIAAIYELLVNKGFDVYYLHLPEAPSDSGEMNDRIKEKYYFRKYRTFTSSKIKLVFKALKTILLRKKVREVKIDDFLVNGDIAFYKNILKKVNPDVVWINYVFYSMLFDYTPPGILKVLDTHDSLYLRSIKVYKEINGYKHLKFSLADEIRCINRADTVVCIQQSEELFFKEHGCLKTLSTIGHIHPYTPTEIRKIKTKLLFLANDHFIYKDAIINFIKDIWPALKAENPGIKLFIAGRICRRLNKDNLNSSISLLGLVPDLQGLYNSIDVTINPVIPGSGLKIKNIESLCFGKPVVTTPSGKEGLEGFENKGLIAAKSPEEWVNSITLLLNDTSYYNAQIADLENSIEQYNNINITEFDKLLSIKMPGQKN